MIRIAKNAGFNLTATLIVAVTSFAASIISARILGPSAFGELSYVTWLFATLVLLFNPGVSAATERFVAELEGARRRLVGNSLTLILLTVQVGIGLLAGFLLAAFSPSIAAILGQPSAQPYFFILAVGIPIAMTLGVLRARLAGFQRYDLISMVSVLSGVTTLVGTILLLYYGFGVGGLIWLTIGVYCLQLTLVAALVWKRHNVWPLESVPSSQVRRVVSYSLGIFIISSFDAIVWQRSETFFLGRYSTADQIAYYGLAYNLASVLVIMLPFALTGVLLPALSHHFGAGERDEMQRIYATATKYVGLLSLPMALGCIAVAEPLVKLLYGVDYSPVVLPLRILLIAGMAGAITGPGSALFLALGRPYLAGLWGIPIAILNLVLGFNLVSPYGATGAALASTICQVLGVVIGALYLVSYQKFRLPFASLLRIALAASVSAGVAYLVSMQLTGWTGLLIAAILSAGIYILTLIAIGVFDSFDFALLREISDRLPHRLGILLEYLVNFVEATDMRLRRVV